jgi:alkylated DNA repair dioxygenase AlkB
MQTNLFKSNKEFISKDGKVIFYENFFTETEADFFLKDLLENIEWRHEAIKLYGKEVMQPRLTAWYGDEGVVYGYSGIKLKPLDWTPSLLKIKEKIEAASGAKFNSVLLNQYRSGQDSMGWHRDNEKELGKNPIIASVSFGASRSFQFRHYFDKQLKHRIELNHGSFLLMKNETQHFWEHQIPKTAKPVSTRINLTFRWVFGAD